jgi:hypothetical protein
VVRRRQTTTRCLMSDGHLTERDEVLLKHPCRMANASMDHRLVGPGSESQR